MEELAQLVAYLLSSMGLIIATRVGGPTGSVTIMAYDGNKNLLDVIGPATRGTPAQTLSAIIGDAFGGSSSVTFSGDWLVQNTYDGFDRKIDSTDAAGGMVLNTFDPGNRTIATQTLGSPGGPTPADRSGSSNVNLASSEMRFDEAGRQYEAQRDVFLDSGYYVGGTPGLPSGRSVTHTGGGLATNSTANDHTGTVTLRAGVPSYVLSRTVFDRADRMTAAAADNGAITTILLDGAGRQPVITDALGNVVMNSFDGNGNVTFATRMEKCTISGVTTIESFTSAFAFDVLNRSIVTMQQGPDGSLSTNWSACCTWPVLPPTLFTFTGYDSRGNRTNLVDPKQNTTIWEFDGASRQLREKRHLRPSGDGTSAVFDTVVTRTAFDANSNTIRLVDDNGGITAWTYDLLDRNTQMIFHDGSTRTNVFNAASNVVGYTDENLSAFINTFDVLGREIAVAITPAAGVAGDATLGIAGTLAQSFQFDGLSRMTFGRDSVGLAGGISLANTDFGKSYDSINRILEEQQASAGDTRYVTHHAWKSLPATGLTFPSSRQIGMAFDALYRKNGVGEGTNTSNIAQWNFFGGRVATVALGNGITTSFMNDAQTRSAVQLGQTTPPWGDITSDHLGYDGSGRLIGKRHLTSGGATLVGFTTAYDPSSNKLFERALHAESRSALYSMDSMDRLLQYQRGVLASGGGSITTPITLPGTNNSQSYALDGLGNWGNTIITPEGGTAETQVRTHNKLNQVTAAGGNAIPYDQGNNAGTKFPSRGNGNIAGDGTYAYFYDALNRLVQAQFAGASDLLGNYAYDALNRRTQRIVNGADIGTISGSWRYLYDGSRIVEEFDVTAGSTFIESVWGQYVDELVQLEAYAEIGEQMLPAGTYYLLSDLLYRSAALTDSSGAVVETYDTDAYGNTIIFNNPGTDGLWFTDDDGQASWAACRYVFTGREYDWEVGNYFYRARYYEPGLGRFVARDPLIYVDGCNAYQLDRGNPLSRLDHSGMDSGLDPWIDDGPPIWNGDRVNQTGKTTWDGPVTIVGMKSSEPPFNCYVNWMQAGTSFLNWTETGTQKQHRTNVDKQNLTDQASALQNAMNNLGLHAAQLNVEGNQLQSLAISMEVIGLAFDAIGAIAEFIPGAQLQATAVLATGLTINAAGAGVWQMAASDWAAAGQMSLQQAKDQIQYTALENEIASMPDNMTWALALTRRDHLAFGVTRQIRSIQVPCCLLGL